MKTLTKRTRRLLATAVVPAQSPRFGGDFVLDSQGDLQLIFDRITGVHQSLSVLNLSTSVDDSAWATRFIGALYTTDSSSNTVDVVTGTFNPGTAYTDATPCNANSPRRPARRPGSRPTTWPRST